MVEKKALDIGRVINVDVSFTPSGAQYRNFGGMLILGNSDVLPVTERIRLYESISDISADFGVDSREYKAALHWFSQEPKPKNVYIGRMLNTPAQSTLVGIATSPDLPTFQAINNGGFSISIGGQHQQFTGMDFSGVTDTQGIVDVINAVTSLEGVTALYQDSSFILRLATAGPVTLSKALMPDSGTSISDLTGLSSGTVSMGYEAETPVEAVTTMMDDLNWYALCIVAEISDAEHIAVADLIEAATPSRLYGLTIMDPATKTNATNDLASRMKAWGYNRTAAEFSLSSPYAVISLFACILTTNFLAQNATITLKFKNQPLLEPEGLTAAEASNLKSKNVNVFAYYNNDTAIIQEGTLFSGRFIDAQYGADWLQNTVQTNVWNTLFTCGSKIPQTDGGMTTIIAAVEAGATAGVNNGLIAPGQWNADGFGQLKKGDYLPTGFYTYAPPMASQDQSEREQRKAPPVQMAVKFAGALHFADIKVNVNQ